MHLKFLRTALTLTLSQIQWQWKYNRDLATWATSPWAPLSTGLDFGLVLGPYSESNPIELQAPFLTPWELHHCGAGVLRGSVVEALAEEVPLVADRVVEQRQGAEPCPQERPSALAGEQRQGAPQPNAKKK